MSIQERRKQWLAALRSGEYKQHFGAMRGPEPKCFCALGVALKISGFYKTTFNKVEAGKYLRDYLGLDSLKRSLVVEMNDGENLSFNEIADRMEAIL